MKKLKCVVLALVVGVVSLILINTKDITSDYVVNTVDMVDAQAIVSDTSKSELSEKEISGLILMREEEKLARDVYTTLGNIWGLKIFLNISASEQTHMNAIGTLLVKYGIKDPVSDDSVGVFTSKVLSELYEKMISKGRESLSAALVVGATVEDLDIRDLELLKNETKAEDLIYVYNNLQRGSRNHMRAFVDNLVVRGGSYTPQFIDQGEYLSIIGSAKEKGR